MLGGITGAVVGSAGLGVVGNYTGGWGNCTSRIVTKFDHMLSLLLFFSVLWETDIFTLGNNIKSQIENRDFSLLYALKHIWDYIEEQPSFIHKYSQEDIKLGAFGEYNKLGIMSLLMYQKAINDNNPQNDIYPLLMYLRMTDGISHPRFAIDEASYFHDIYGSSPLKPKSEKANQEWINRANREIFSHDSFSRVYKREFKALGKRCGKVRDLCAGINTIFSWSGQAMITIAGNITFQIANLLN